LNQHNKGTVLIVDDNSINLSVLFESLRLANFKVLIAEDGPSALKRIEHARPDIILLDVRMPNMDGFELYRRLKETYNLVDIPVIFLSVIADPSEKVRAFDLNAVDYITKPFDPREVVARVEKHLTLRNLRISLEEKNIQLEQEITERQRIEEQLKATLAEKEVLLREVHHRVKNNMMALTALISMQAKTIKDPQVVQMFQDLEGRVNAMGLVHRKMYQAEDLAQINFSEYLESLVDDLLQALWDNRPITLHINAENIFVNVNIAIPCSLIINELITNVLKYAFPADRPTNRENILNIGFALNQDEYALTVCDNGVGLPVELDWRNTTSLGLNLVNILATRQLRGTFELDSANGTAITIKFTAQKI